MNRVTLVREFVVRRVVEYMQYCKVSGNIEVINEFLILVIGRNLQGGKIVSLIDVRDIMEVEI